METLHVELLEWYLHHFDVLVFKLENPLFQDPLPLDWFQSVETHLRPDQHCSPFHSNTQRIFAMKLIRKVMVTTVMVSMMLLMMMMRQDEHKVRLRACDVVSMYGLAHLAPCHLIIQVCNTFAHTCHLI